MRDDIQMAVHLMTSENADKVPGNQQKEIRRRNLVKNMWVVLSGAYERQSREGVCNYRVHQSAIQIQIINKRTSK